MRYIYIVHNIYFFIDTKYVKRFLKVSIITASIIIICCIFSVIAFFIITSPDINILNGPNLDLTYMTSSERTIKILDKNDEPIDGVFYGKNKLYVKLSDLQQYTIDAFIAIEDKRFFEHKGIDYQRILSATMSNLKKRRFSQGASTITQQLIKNTYLSNEKTFKRKFNEMRLAKQLEKIYSKEQILENYLNILYFGSGIYGIASASKTMFNKSVNELTLAQSATLASIINNPSLYSPYSNKENLISRKNIVLRQMLLQEYINENEYNCAINEPITFCKNTNSQFVSGIINDACRHYNCTEKELFARHLTLKTKYDTNLSKIVQNAVTKYDNFNGIIRVVVLENNDGKIICDETNKNGYVNYYRSPASTIKPFVSYSPAIENGYNPLSQILDEKTSFNGYTPRNYKDSYRGYQTLRNCLVNSSNVAAVKLLNNVGIDVGIKTATNFGFKFENDDNTLAVALGGMKNGATLIQIANAYRTLANGGIYTPVSYLSCVDCKNTQRRAISDDTAFILTDILCDCADYGTAKKLSTIDNIAAKTGTNGTDKGNNDCYCIAYTPENTIAVWFGANDNNLIQNEVTGASCCDIIKYLFNSGALKSTKQFVMPDSVAYYEVDRLALENERKVYLADPTLPKRYRVRELFSKRFLPIKKSYDIIDFYDNIYWT